MYHSIADAAGPTSIGQATFRMQMEALQASGRPVVPIAALVEARDGGTPVSDDAVVITFDDGFRDFAEQAAPVLGKHGFPATVYLPTDRIGGYEDWATPHRGSRRRLMDWDQVRGLAGDGISFGGHSRSHADLTTLDDPTLDDEVAGSADRIEAELGERPATFAAPYGAADARVRGVIARHYRLAVGTRFDVATMADDHHDLPRIEMHYYRDPGRWRAHLAGQGGWYLGLRKGLRAVRGMMRR